MVEAGDTITLTFSESMWSTSVPSTTDAQLTTASGSGKPVTLDLTGLDGAAFQIDSSNGSGHYLKKGNTATCTGSGVAVSGAQIVVTLDRAVRRHALPGAVDRAERDAQPGDRLDRPRREPGGVDLVHESQKFF